MLDNVELDLGIIGPESQAEAVQRWFHDLFDGIEPRGWDNQLKTEPGLLLSYQRVYLLKLFETAPDTFPARLDLIPHYGLNLGNVETSGLAGAMLRLGINTRNQIGFVPFSTTITAPSGFTAPIQHLRNGRKNFGVYFFGGLEGRAVVHDVFLDGNLFRSSHSVDKNPFVADFRAGLQLMFRRAELSYTITYRTEEFKNQDRAKSFGSISLKLLF